MSGPRSSRCSSIRLTPRPTTISRPIRAAGFAAIIIGAFALADETLAREILPLGPLGVNAEVFPKPDRPVASIISPIWASEDERRSVEETRQVFEKMGIKRGMSVADIGAGSGYYTIQLSKLVGPKGTVFAQDVIADYLKTLDQRVAQLGLTNVRIGLGRGHDPQLRPKSLDAALLIHMYHEIEQPYGMLYNLASALKPGAKIGIVDLDRPTLQHGTPPALLRCEIESVGYRQVSFNELSGNVGYLAIFDVPLLLLPANSIKPCSAPK